MLNEKRYRATLMADDGDGDIFSLGSWEGRAGSEAEVSKKLMDLYWDSGLDSTCTPVCFINEEEEDDDDSQDQRVE